MKFPIQAKPVERQSSSNNVGKGSIHPSDACCGANCCAGACITGPFGTSAGCISASRISGNADCSSDLPHKSHQSCSYNLIVSPC